MCSSTQHTGLTVCVPYGFRKDCTGQFEKTLHRITRWEKTFQIIRSTSNQGRKSPVGLELWKLLDPPKIRHRKNTVRSWTLYFFPLLIKKITHIFACAAKNSGHRKLWHSSKKKSAFLPVHICVAPTAGAKIFFWSLILIMHAENENYVAHFGQARATDLVSPHSHQQSFGATALLIVQEHTLLTTYTTSQTTSMEWQRNFLLFPSFFFPSSFLLH